MRFIPGLASLILVGLLLGGCAGTPSTVNQLSLAGFRVVPAGSDPQLGQLRSLPDHNLSVVRRKGVVFYVYPDKSDKFAYIGGQKQYENYRHSPRPSGRPRS